MSVSVKTCVSLLYIKIGCPYSIFLLGKFNRTKMKNYNFFLKRFAGVTFFFLSPRLLGLTNAPLGSLFGIAPKTDEKTLARCKFNDPSFHHEMLIYLTLFAHIRVTHFSSIMLIASNLGSVLSCIWRM